MSAPEIPKADPRVLRALLPFLAPYRLQAALAGVFLLVAAFATLAVPPLLRQVMDAGFGTALTRGDASALARTLAMLGAAAGVMAVAASARFMVVSWLGERVVADLRRAVHANVLAQPPAFFETLRTGEVLSRLTADTTLVQSLVGSSLSMGLRNAVLLAGSVVMLLVTAPLLTGAVLAFMGVALWVTLRFSRRVRRLSRSSQDRVADLAGSAGETLAAIETVQAFGQEDAERHRFAQAVEEAHVAAMRRTRVRAALMLFVMLAFSGGLLWGAWLGGVAVMEGRSTVGLLSQYLFYAVMAGGAASILSEVWGEMQRAAGAAERLVELLQARPAIVDPPLPLSAPEVAPTGGLAVSLRGVRFAYPSRPEAFVLDGLDIELAPGERVALVGRSGAGKSTVLQLLQRLREPQAGAILLGGVPLSSLRLQDLRRQVALVPQSPVVFSGDAWRNLRYGAPGATDEQVIAAARAAQAHDFLCALPQGYATELGERGVRLSGGQRQRLAIARALLRDAPVLLLDEATSALDAESEAAVQRALHEAMRGRTTLVVAHRLATVRDVDRVLVMDAGRVVEAGPHSTLMERDGLYARLVRMQALTD